MFTLRSFPLFFHTSSSSPLSPNFPFLLFLLFPLHFSLLHLFPSSSSLFFFPSPPLPLEGFCPSRPESPRPPPSAAQAEGKRPAAPKAVLVRRGEETSARQLRPALPSLRGRSRASRAGAATYKAVSLECNGLERSARAAGCAWEGGGGWGWGSHLLEGGKRRRGMGHAVSLKEGVTGGGGDMLLNDTRT